MLRFAPFYIVVPAMKYRDLWGFVRKCLEKTSRLEMDSEDISDLLDATGVTMTEVKASAESEHGIAGEPIGYEFVSVHDEHIWRIIFTRK